MVVEAAMDSLRHLPELHGGGKYFEALQMQGPRSWRTYG